MRCVSYLVVFAVLLTCCKATGIFDLLKWGLDLGAPSFGREAEDESSLEDEEENCLCANGLSCNCCMRLNFTLIDFGEPGCVNIQYAAFDQSLEFNMTFGENELHTQSVDVDNIEPVCMNLVGDVPLAYICASLTKFKMEGTNMRGCVHLEPTLLGEAQARYFVGCFGFGNGTRSANSTRFPVTGSGKRPGGKVGNKTSSIETTGSGQSGGSGSSSGELGSSSAQSGSTEEPEDEEETPPSGLIEQGANILSNIFYYFSPDSGEEEEEKDDVKLDKIVLVSSTEAAGKEELGGGVSELPPPLGSEEYDEGEEEEDEGQTEDGSEATASGGATAEGSSSAGR